jgi:hypothetical protein
LTIEIDELLSMLDEDGDGTISYDEFACLFRDERAVRESMLRKRKALAKQQQREYEAQLALVCIRVVFFFLC